MSCAAAIDSQLALFPFSDWSVTPMSSLDTTVTSSDADDSFTSQSSTDSFPSTPTSLSKTALFSTSPAKNMVLHYQQTAFPVHSSALAHSSTYFATHLASDSSSSSCPAPCEQCDSTTHCLTLPTLCTMHSRLSITSEQFQHFLRQLHLPTHYHCPSLSPSSTQAPQQPPTLLPHSYPTDLPLQPVADVIEHDNFQLGDSLDTEAFLTLAHHFGCSALLERCDALLLQFYSQLPTPVDLWMAWDRLVTAHCFGLHKLRAHCLQLVSRDTRMDSEYDENRMTLKRQAGEQLYQQLMDEMGEMVLLRAHERLGQHRAAVLGRVAIRSVSV